MKNQSKYKADFSRKTLKARIAWSVAFQALNDTLGYSIKQNYHSK
jgi:hypothetical protein